MTITPLAAAAVPAGIAAVKIAQHTIENRPFRSLLAQLGAPQNDPSPPPQDAGQTEQTEFLKMVKNSLAGAGIDTKLSFEISSDSEGKLQIGGNHPRQSEIEQILNGSDEVVAAFHRLAATTQSTTTGEAQRAFAEQYVRAPETPAPPSVNNTHSFSIRINGDKIEVQ